MVVTMTDQQSELACVQAREEQCAENERMRGKLDELAADLYLAQQDVEKLTAENAALKQDQDSCTAVRLPDITAFGPKPQACIMA